MIRPDYSEDFYPSYQYGLPTYHCQKVRVIIINWFCVTLPEIMEESGNADIVLWNNGTSWKLARIPHQIPASQHFIEFERVYCRFSPPNEL